MLLALWTLGSASASAIVPRHESISFSGPFEVEASGVTNIHISYNRPVSGDLSIFYGSCSEETSLIDSYHHHHLIGRTAVGDHPLARRHVDHPSQRPERFVWIVPHDTPSGGCLNAYSGTDLLGYSAPISVVARKKKRSMKDDIDFADV
jgi:hypothetical protein